MPIAAQENVAGKKRFAIAIHGGAGQSPKDEEAGGVKASMERALDIGLAVLQKDGTSLDAVEQVIRFLEDDPLFNAGRGAVFNAAGQHELDASIMDGRTLGCGGVAGVRTVRHPISLSRLVMEQTKHVLLASDGAEKFADEMGSKIERVENSWFSTEKRRQELERARRAKPGDKQTRIATDDPHYGTVGCVALDTHGNLAAGTSTGGRTNKKYGRVGDSPIIGAGTYGNNATCAISGTGLGEQFIRYSVAFNISARMAYLKQPLKDAVNEVLHKTLNPTDAAVFYSRLTKWDQHFDNLPVHAIQSQLYFRLAFEPEVLGGYPSHFTVDISETLEQKIASVRCYQTQFPPGKAHVFDRIRGAAMLAGAAANFAAGETFVSTRPLGSLDLVKTVLPRMQAV